MSQIVEWNFRNFLSKFEFSSRETKFCSSLGTDFDVQVG